MDARNLPGSLKIAILVQAMGPETSRIIMNSLGESEKSAVTAHMEQLGNVSPDLVEKIAEEFCEHLQRRNAKDPGGKAAKLSKGGEETGAKAKAGGANLDAVAKLSPDRLLKLVENERPQTVALILVHAKTETASDVMSRLPDDVKTDVALRIAKLDKVNSGMVEEMNQVIETILSNKESGETHETGGVDRLAEILNLADEMSSELIMSEIEEHNPELAAQIKQKMFVFEDVVLVDDRGFQKLLRKVETSELAVALKAASEEVKEKVFRNMSTRAGDMLREEIADMGPVRMNDVSAAQQKITGLIQDMEFKGELIISGRRGEAIVA
jgi:flagellar motor switch protein FliG